MAVNRYYSSSAIDTTLDIGIDASATQIKLASTAGMPQSYPFTLAIGFDLSTEELVNVVGVGSTTNSYKVGTVVGSESTTGRGIDGTTAQSHAAGVAVRHVFTARDMREAQEHIDATGKYTVTNGTQTEDQDLHGIGAGEGVVVGTAKTQTLTNKSMSGAQNTFTSIPASSITDTAVTLTATQTLTNKTLTSPKVNENVAVTATATELNVLDGITASTAELNILDGVTASTAELNLLDGVTATTTEINYLDGVTSNIQTQFNNLVTVPTGVISSFAGSAANVPTGWLICDGSAVSRTTYSALFSLISTTYGNGNGSTTFNLPNLKGRVPVGLDSAQTEFDNLAETGGEKAVTLTEAQMPAHTHSLTPAQIVGGGSGGTNNYAPTGNSPSAQTTITSTGGGQAHNNLQPYIVLNYIIKH